MHSSNWLPDRRAWTCHQWLPVLLPVCLALALARPALACQLPQTLQQLTFHLSTAAAAHQAEAPRQSAAIRDLLSDLSEVDLMAALADNGQRRLQPLALDLLAQGQQLAADGFVRRPATLQALLSQMDRALISVCETQAQSETAWMDVAGWIEGGENGDGGMFERLRENRPAQAGMLMGALAGFVLLVYLADFAYRQSMAMLYNRKMCLIPARIDSGSDMVSGHVITLGRGGFRFEPSAQAGPGALIRSVSALQVELDIGGLRFAARPTALLDHHADFRLDEALSLSNQKMLLSASVISPYYVRKPRRMEAERIDAATGPARSPDTADHTSHGGDGKKPAFSAATPPRP